MRIGDPGEVVVFPIDRFQRTEQNLLANDRVQLRVASRMARLGLSCHVSCHTEGTLPRYEAMAPRVIKRAPKA